MSKLPVTHPLEESPLFGLRNKRLLARRLGVTPGELCDLLAEGDDGYRLKERETRPGKVRVIQDPKRKLKRVQAKIAGHLSRITPPHFLTCPVKRRSYVSNAAVHVGAREIVTLDIAEYFPSTTANRVSWFFHQVLGCSGDVAMILRQLSTYADRLPTGSPLSPILSYYAHMDMWLTVERLCRERGCEFTLYMDDLTISGPKIPRSLIFAIKRAIIGVGLRPKDSKERHYTRGVGVVTGVVVTPHGIRPKNGSHLTLKLMREERRRTVGPEAEVAARRLLGKETQHRQIRKANAAEDVEPTSI